MPDRISADELARRAGQLPELVERLVALGIMAPGEDGLFPAGEVTLVVTLAAFEESGIALEDVAAGVASGDLDYRPVETYFPDPPQAAGTVAELAERVGRPAAFVARLLGPSGCRSRLRATPFGRTTPPPSRPSCMPGSSSTRRS